MRAHVLILLAASVGCSTALAQTLSPPDNSPLGPNSTTYSRSTEGGLYGEHETPTLRQQKLRRAIALREEATALLRSDGGELTAEHAAYIRRKACAIRGVSGPTTGTLVPGPAGGCG